MPLTGGKIVLTDDAQAIETQHLGFTISPHEECGVEEAVRLIEAHGGESVVLTLGPPEAEEQLRDAMALGIDRAIHLVTDGEEWDPQATAAAIVDAIRADEAAHGAASTSSSSGTSRPTRAASRSGSASPMRSGDRSRPASRASPSRADRPLRAGGAGGRDVFELPLPAVVTVKEGLEPPALPVGARRSCGHSASRWTRRSPARPGSRSRSSGSSCPESQGKQAEILGHGPEAAPRSSRCCSGSACA